MDTVTELMIYLKLKYSQKLSFGKIFKHPCMPLLFFIYPVKQDPAGGDRIHSTLYLKPADYIVQNYDSGMISGHYNHYDIIDVSPSNTFARIWRNCLLILNLIG